MSRDGGRAVRVCRCWSPITVVTVTPTHNPAALSDYDPGWPSRAEQLLADIRAALRGVPGGSDAAYDHIGSTSVPGLAAKPFIDLQVRMSSLPSDAALTESLEPLGYRRARGARPDSPGVDRDIPRGARIVDDVVWEKSLFVHDDGVIVHIRRSDSPWGEYTVWFRDWLRAHPQERERYEALKRELSAENMGKPDYDDYTRAKTEFFDEVQEQFEEWAARAVDPASRGSS